MSQRKSTAKMGTETVGAGPEVLLEAIHAADNELHSRFASKLKVNPDLDRRLVSFQANKRESEHRWCKYKEGFSAGLIRYIFDQLSIDSGTVLDPFAGAGTTLFIASERGLDSVGIELLPSSAEIIAVRRDVMGCDKAKVAAALRSFAERRSWESDGSAKPFKHLRITNGAFPAESERLLCRYLSDCDRQRDKTVRSVLRFAAMCVLESISYTRKDGQYLRWDHRSGRRQGDKPFDKGTILPFSDAVRSKLSDIAADLSGDGSLFPAESAGTPEQITLHNGSCLEILPTLPAHSFDAIITSPPYCNRYDYTRTYALELAMKGIAEDQLVALRQAMLSCTVENKEKQGLTEVFDRKLFDASMRAFDSQVLLNQVLYYLEQCRVAGTINNTGIPRMVRGYFRELAVIIFQCAKLLKPGAPFVMVNDNVRYQGAHLPVDLILSEIAEKAGFAVERIWVLPVGKGNSSQQMGEHGRKEIRKCVYVWRLKGQRAKLRGRQLAQAR